MSMKKRVFYTKGWSIGLFFMCSASWLLYVIITRGRIEDFQKDPELIFGFLMLIIVIIIGPIRQFTTRYIIEDDKFIWSRFGGLIKTEALLKDIHSYREALWLISSWVWLDRYSEDPVKNGTRSFAYIAMRRKPEAELVREILKHNPKCQIDYKFYKLIKKYYNEDYRNNIIPGTEPLFFD